MSQFTKLLANHLFQVGTFFQINWYNPVFLDKTGAAMVRTKGRLNKWQGGIDGFSFSHTKLPYKGKVSMDRYWVEIKTESYLNPEFLDTIKSISKSITVDLNDFIEIYGVTQLKRIGLRHQSVFDKYNKRNVNNFHSLVCGNYKKLVEKYNGKNQGIHLLLEKECKKISLAVSIASKTDETKPGPPKGFMIDYDIYKEVKIETKVLENTLKEKEELIEYFCNNYEEFISEILYSMGISK